MRIMADREAKLRLVVELVAAGKTTEAIALLNAEIARGGEVASKTTAALTGTAEAVDFVAEAEAEAADETARLSGALAHAGDEAVESAQKAASAAAGEAQALGDVTVAATEQAAAARQAGQAAVKSGEDVQQSADHAASAVEKLTREWKEEVVAAKAAGVAFDEATAVAAIEKLADSIRKSGDSLENRKAALEGLADGITEYFRRVEDATEGAGTETTEQGKLIEATLAKVQAQIAEVDAGLRGVGPAATEGGEQARDAFLSVEKALELANGAAASAQTKLDETGRIPRKSIADLAAVIETVSIAMERTAQTSDAATAEQLANFEALRIKLGELTEVTNRQVNAAGDNSGALKETGNQVNDLTGALSGLINVTGSGSTVFGTAVQKIGAGASAYERAKDAVKTLHLNTLSASASTATLASQIAILAAVAIGSIKIGLELAATNKENAATIESMGRAAKGTVPSLQEMSSRMDGVQSAGQDLLILMAERFPTVMKGFAVGFAEPSKSAEELTERTRALIDEERLLAKETEGLTDVMLKLAVASSVGRTKAELFALAQRQGFGANEAYKLSVKDGTTFQEAYNKSLEAGARGRDLYDATLRASNGSATEFASLLPGLIVKLDEELRVTKLLAEAEDDRNKALRDGINLAQVKGDSIDRQLSAEEAMLLRVSHAYEAVDTATNGTTVAITEAAKSISAFLPAAEANIVKLQGLAAALADVAGKTEFASSAERQRVATIADLASRADELTASETRQLVQLLEQIKNGERVTAVTVDRTIATETLTEAVRELTGSERLAMAAEAERLRQLESELEIIGNLIREEEQRLGIGVERAERNIYEGASLDYLRQREAQLKREQEERIIVIHGSAKAEDTASEAREKLVTIIEREKAAADGAASSHKNLTQVIENGRVVWTNLTEEQEKVRAKGIEVVDANEKLKKSADDAAAVLRNNLASSVTEVHTRFDALISKGGEVEAMLERVNEAIRKMDKSAADAAATIQ